MKNQALCPVIDEQLTFWSTIIISEYVGMEHALVIKLPRNNLFYFNWFGNIGFEIQNSIWPVDLLNTLY
ncbi:hypothetical protein BST98_16235 [Photobacterium damselae]|nr:hypothetical protein BST98_16235 [Photobacterium damselae]